MQNKNMKVNLQIKRDEAKEIMDWGKVDLWDQYSEIRVSTTQGEFTLTNESGFDITTFSNDTFDTVSFKIGASIKGIIVYNAGEDTTLSNLNFGKK